jgi:hypothetical protein
MHLHRLCHVTMPQLALPDGLRASRRQNGKPFGPVQNIYARRTYNTALFLPFYSVCYYQLFITASRACKRYVQVRHCAVDVFLAMNPRLWQMHLHGLRCPLRLRARLQSASASLPCLPCFCFATMPGNPLPVHRKQCTHHDLKSTLCVQNYVLYASARATSSAQPGCTFFQVRTCHKKLNGLSAIGEPDSETVIVTSLQLLFTSIYAYLPCTIHCSFGRALLSNSFRWVPVQLQLRPPAPKRAAQAFSFNPGIRRYIMDPRKHVRHFFPVSF